MRGTGIKSKTPAILCVIHHRQNPIESTWRIDSQIRENTDFGLFRTEFSIEYLDQEREGNRMTVETARWVVSQFVLLDKYIIIIIIIIIIITIIMAV
jgi:hypothetical protein